MRRVSVGIAATIFAIAISITAEAQSQLVTHVPAIDPAQVNKAFQDIYATPPTLRLTPHTPEARHGNVWLRTTAEGLHIWGNVERGSQEVQWAEQKSDILASDHIEVWLATTTDVAMPAIGWGNQFGMSELKSVQDCAEVTDPHTGSKQDGARICERWFQDQVRYRQQLRRLFARQWLITGNHFTGQTHSFEEFATSAYDSLQASLFPEDLPSLLKPKRDDAIKVEIADDVTPEARRTDSGVKYQYNRPTGYHFHVFIPYTEFPPAQQLKLSDLYVAVAAFGAAPEGKKQGPYSSTSPTLQWGKPDSFNHVVVDAPGTYEVSPCQYKLEQNDLNNDSFPAWFLPTAPNDPDLRSIFALINPEQGYLYEPGGVSPEVWPEKYFWKSLNDGATVCGPKLAWRKGADVRQSKFDIDEQHLATRTLPDGWTLLQSGPSTSPLSQFGSGQCGACPVLNFAIYAVSPQGEISEVLNLDQPLSGAPERPSGADMTIAPDLSRVILYLTGVGGDGSNPEYGASGWKALTYCLDGHVYKKCGEEKNVKPPDPPHFKELLGPE